jgi:RNA polymerase sigma factor (sigma-70 family)
MDDFELIKRCISGDKESWDCFVEQFTRLIYDSVIRTLRQCGQEGAWELVNDLYQDIFLSLLEDRYKALREFKGRNGCRLAHYLRTIAVRKTIDHLRSSKRMVSFDQQGDGNEMRDLGLLRELAVFNTHRDLDEGEAGVIAGMLLSKLQDDERSLCQMFYHEGRKPQEIADHFGITVAHFYVRKQRILNRLKKIAVDKKVVR